MDILLHTNTRLAHAQDHDSSSLFFQSLSQNDFIFHSSHTYQYIKKTKYICFIEFKCNYLPLYLILIYLSHGFINYNIIITKNKFIFE